MGFWKSLDVAQDITFAAGLQEYTHGKLDSLAIAYNFDMNMISLVESSITCVTKKVKHVVLTVQMLNLISNVCARG